MTCQNCARHVREAIVAVPGVKEAKVELEQGRAQVRWSAAPDLPAVLRSLDEAGYPGRVAESEHEHKGEQHGSGWKSGLILGVTVTLILMALEWGARVGTTRWYQWLSFALVLPVQIWAGRPFYQGAWRQLKQGRSNMDTLVALGSTTAFLYSVFGLFAGWPGHLFFMDAAAIISLVSLGHHLEAKASAQAGASLRALFQLAPPTARRVGADGVEQAVPASEIRVGDRVVLAPGDRVPVDGVVQEGASALDESMLTGEALPIEKGAGSKVYAGTINSNGRLVIEVTASGEATALARIIEVVEQAQNSRANIQRLGDRVSSVFVPIVIAIALGAALWWGLAPESARQVHEWLARFLWHGHSPEGALAAAVFHAAAVLIIACPCAMGLATPVAIMAGTNVAARRGILIRDGVALEKAGQITAVLFDKTGTLTQGKLSVAAVEPTGSLDRAAVERLAVALARPSAHPLSEAVATIASDAVDAVDQWREIRGAGVEALRQGTPVRLGRLDWLQSTGVDTARLESIATRWRAQGATVIGLALGIEGLAAIALRDSPKPRSREVIDELRRTGLGIYMVTGDHRDTALAVARELGIAEANVHPETRPEGKVEVIRKLQQSGQRVAFAGDGINDAPALEQADLGIALLNASDVARESADIVLLRADVEAIPAAIRLAQATLRTIKQNLFWAFFYNAAAIPLAALGFLSPIVSALAMGLSDFIVIGNALRLRRISSDGMVGGVAGKE